MRRLSIAAALVSLFAATLAHAAGDPDAGKAKAAACAACHGIQGHSPNNPVWPKLAGQHPNYLRKQLRGFKSGARKNETMSPMAAPLGEQDIEDLAAYFSGQEVTVDSADPKKAALGAQIYRAGIPGKGVGACMGCHGPTGRGNPPAVFPWLSGQHAAYVAKTLKDFRDGNRANDPNEMMRLTAGPMSDKEIGAVAEYISGLY